MTTADRKTGDFCWINLLTTEPKKAGDFFSNLLGWTFGDLGGVGSSIKVGGSEIGGMFDLAAPNTPPGTPPGIGVMVKSDNADASVEKANSVGGSAKPAFNIMDEGRMAELKDPSGARIDIWQPKKRPMSVADKSRHGAPSWFENYATNAEIAAKFYSDMFGWVAEVMPMPNMTYTTFKLGDTQIAGMMEITPQMAGMSPDWSTYFTVNDIDASARKAQELGGSLFVPPTDIPGVGRFSGVTSPQGVKFFIITYTRRS